MADPVYLSITELPGTGAAAPTVVDFNFAGGYINRTHIKAYTLDTTTFTKTDVTVLAEHFVTDWRLSLPVSVPVGSVLRVYRDTPKDAPLVDFTNGARINEGNLDLVAQQAAFVAAEAIDKLSGIDEGLAAAVAAAASEAAAAASAAAALSSQTSAAASASAASTSVGAAAASQSAAAASAAAASSYAAAADSDAAAAASSAAAAAANKTAAAASAAAALGSQESAAYSESVASASAEAAAASQSAAAESAEAAAASQSAAAESAAAASSYATAAGSDAAAAAASAAAAAAGSASAASSSETAAAISAAEAAASAASVDGTILVHKTGDEVIAGTKTFTAPIVGITTGNIGGWKNIIINGNFSVNQRGYTSGTATTGANQYTLDRWRVVTSGQAVTFTTTGAGRTVTAPSGGFEQVIEGASIGGGTYVINWTGTASCTVNGVSYTKGATFTLTAGSNATVRFSSGTVTDAQIEPGEVATAFELRPAAVELLLCQRYYQTSGEHRSWGYGPAYRTFGSAVRFAVPMRAIPTVLQLLPVYNNCSDNTVGGQRVDGFSAYATITTTGNASLTFTWTASAEL